METKEQGIRIDGLTKIYKTKRDGSGSPKTVLDHVSYFFPYGKVTALMGPSGGGKTTLLRILLGFEEADEGTVTGLPEKISAVFQEDRLAEDYSVLANVLLPFDPKTKKEKEELTEKARGLLKQVGLEGEETKKVRLLSGGMKRRVAIVRALMTDSELLILDEPLKGLDEKTRDTVIEVLRAYGKTILMVTHDPEEARLMGADIRTVGA